MGQAIQAEQGAVTGAVPLTPIQRWFFERELRESHHFNQAVLLEAREALDPLMLEEVVARLLAHHDALRLRYGSAGDDRQQADHERGRSSCRQRPERAERQAHPVAEFHTLGIGASGRLVDPFFWVGD